MYLAEALLLGRTQLRNRIVMAPMTRRQSPDRLPTAEVAEYYGRRARGGVGLIVTEGVLVEHPLASGDRSVPELTERTEAAWRSVTDAVHDEGGVIIAQLWHQGPETMPGLIALGRLDAREGVATTTDSDHDAVVAAFGGAAHIAAAAGFDSAEVHAGARAMAAKRHMHEFGTTSEQLVEIAVAVRGHAQLNPNARYRDPLTIDDVMTHG